MKITTSKEALAAGENTYFTGNPCKRGHVAIRYTLGRCCITCTSLCRTAWYKTNPKKHRASTARWRQANGEKISAYRRTHTERDNAVSIMWRQKNPGKLKARCAKYRATKLQRTPPWSDPDAIQAFYVGCPDGHHVDHEIPLQGKLISGLHVLENLQYLPAVENLSKGNRIDLAAPELL